VWCSYLTRTHTYTTKERPGDAANRAQKENNFPVAVVPKVHCVRLKSIFIRPSINCVSCGQNPLSLDESSVTKKKCEQTTNQKCDWVCIEERPVQLQQNGCDTVAPFSSHYNYKMRQKRYSFQQAYVTNCNYPACLNVVFKIRTPALVQTLRLPSCLTIYGKA
jgi:hypothetical protein